MLCKVVEESQGYLTEEEKEKFFELLVDYSDMSRSLYESHYYIVNGHAILPIRWIAWLPSVFMENFRLKQMSGPLWCHHVGDLYPSQGAAVQSSLGCGSAHRRSMMS